MERLNQQLNARVIAIMGVMIAVVFVTTFLVKIPMPVPAGYVHPGDAVIYMAAFLFGQLVGFAAGAFGTGLADLATGTYANYAPGSFVIHGVQGLVAGAIAWRGSVNRMILAAIVDGVILMSGYCIYDFLILRIGFDVYVPGHTFLHAVDARVKLISAALAAGLVLLWISLPLFLVTLVMTHLGLRSLGFGWRRIGSIWLALAPFMLLIAALRPLFDRAGNTP